VIQLRRLDNDAEIAVLPSTLSATAYTSRPMGLLPMGQYRLTVFSNGVPSVSTALSVLMIPAAPTLLRLIPGSGQMRVFFTPPADTGAALTYTATCTNGISPRIGTGSASPVTVTGLTNSVTYSCSISAANSAGSSPASTSLVKIVKPVNIAPILNLLLD